MQTLDRLVVIRRLTLVLLAATLASPGARAADSPNGTQNGAQPAAPPAPAGAAGGTRNFYQVLEDVLADFEYDLKNGNVSGLKDMSIRNVATSENIPPSFKSHLELLVTERVLKNARTRVIQCLQCRAKKTTLSGDQMVISSSESNPTELARIAKLSGIQNYMDISFAYQPSGIILSMFITDPESGSITWSRSYNSETSRASAFRRGVDFAQADEARSQTTYQPAVQYRPSVYYLFEPNTTGQTGCLGFGFRMVERYDNRKKEVGFELNYLLDSSTLVGSKAASSTAKNVYSGLNATLLFHHAWNLIGEEENFNRVRGSIFLAAGGTYASGFLGALVRSGYEWRLGRKSAVTAVLGYRPSSTAFIGSSSAGSVGGLEYGLGVSMLF